MPENLESNGRPTVVIIGGGVSGTLTAVNLLRREKTSIEIVLIEKRLKIGLGLAYSTPCSEHLLNVRASGMSALPDDPTHFLKFAQKADDTVNENTFVSRKFFGHYINSLLEESCQAATAKGASFKHVCSEALDIEKVDNGYKVFLESGQQIIADVVVLALGNLSATKPRWTANLSEGNESYLHDPWDNNRFQKITSEQDVLIIGTGLTAIDKLVQLSEAGHKGKLYAISRHGLFPRPHTVKPAVSKKRECDLPETVRSMFEEVKRNARTASDWRSVIDGLRTDTQKWWCNLAHNEQKRFLRHIQTYWDVHRHRMAPQIAAIVENQKTSGQLTLLAGRIQTFEEVGGTVKVTFKQRHHSDATTVLVDRIINCTGPQSRLETVDSSLLHNLQKRGLVQAHALGAGIACTNDGQVIDCTGAPQRRFVALGPMLKAQLLESVAVPELKVQARSTAEAIYAEIGG